MWLWESVQNYSNAIEWAVSGIPVALVVALLLIKNVIGKTKASDGSTSTGVMAIISKVNDLMNDNSQRKKIDAEADKIRADAELTRAKTDKIRAKNMPEDV